MGRPVAHLVDSEADVRAQFAGALDRRQLTCRVCGDTNRVMGEKRAVEWWKTHVCIPDARQRRFETRIVLELQVRNDKVRPCICGESERGWCTRRQILSCLESIMREPPGGWNGGRRRN